MISQKYKKDMGILPLPQISAAFRSLYKTAMRIKCMAQSVKKLRFFDAKRKRTAVA